MVQGFEKKELCFHMHDNYKVMIHIIVYEPMIMCYCYQMLLTPYLHNLWNLHSWSPFF